jgi:hypothetical protein
MKKFLANKTHLAITIACVVVVTVVAAVVIPRLINNVPPEPVDPVITVGQRVAVTLSAAAVDDMYGYQFNLNYNGDDLIFDEDGKQSSDELASLVTDINTIFYKPFDGYLLVGALMVGDRTGFTGENIPVCKVVFESKVEKLLSEFEFSLSKVNVVNSELVYIENITDWTFETAFEPAAAEEDATEAA